jgi:hypothetical protein
VAAYQASFIVFVLRVVFEVALDRFHLEELTELSIEAIISLCER